MQRGVATFTLDYGKCPPWLFQRMVKLGREMTQVLVDEYGPDEFVKRIANPVWFQALGTVLAFDWNASGLTTILTAALKESIRGQEKDLGIFICGGKGKTSRKTPEEITTWGQRLSLPAPEVDQLVYNSKLSAKVDSSLVQDGFQIYHHAFFFSKNGAWTVVQQGMNTQAQSARRYHWHDRVNDQAKNENLNFVDEPHTAIASQAKVEDVLDMSAHLSGKNQAISIDLASNYSSVMRDFKILAKHASRLSRMVDLQDQYGENLTLLELDHGEFKHHPVEAEDFSENRYLKKILARLSEKKPKSYENFLATEGVGPKTVRALSLVAEVIYGAQPSYQDPARYSFAHGGKDATPFPVDLVTYDQTIATMKDAVSKTKLNTFEKDKVLKRLPK
ncbi:DUF763 domain-containing protein [Candidatus Curtissbacteria bacterium]|nr:DUF763 domain-containing protein [Candidatus Curtissbacteria bacterium]